MLVLPGQGLIADSVNEKLGRILLEGLINCAVLAKPNRINDNATSERGLGIEAIQFLQRLNDTSTNKRDGPAAQLAAGVGDAMVVSRITGLVSEGKTCGCCSVGTHHKDAGSGVMMMADRGR